MSLARVAAVLVALAAASPGRAEGPLRVAAASDLKFALEEIVADYRRVHPGAVELVFGSSGKFYAQLVAGAPFDVYLSADADYPRRLLAAGIAVPGSEFPYATGRIVLWVPRESPLAVERDGMKVLGAVRRLAIANPRHAPYGKAAEAALRTYGYDRALRGKLVLGENASQAAQFAQTRSVDAAILPLSLASAPALAKDGRHFLIPMDAHPRLDQVGVRIRASARPAEAERFAAYLTSAAARSVLERHGFVLPGG